MSFIDKSEQNMKKYTSSFKEEKKLVPLLKEVSGGSVGGFVGRAGMGIDSLFAGPYHPDYNEVDKLLKKQVKDRLSQRAEMEKEAGDDYTGIPDPVGGYYETDTEITRLAYDELETRRQLAIDYSIEHTPPADIEWKSGGWDYDYDEIIKYIEEEDFINTSETNMKNVNIDLKYDDFDETMGRDIRNKMFQKVEKIIDEEEIQVDNQGFIEKSKTNINKIIDEKIPINRKGISLKTIYKNDIGLSIHIGS